MLLKNTRWLKKRYFIAVLISCSSHIWAQDTIKISIEDAIQAATIANEKITLAKLNEKIAQAQYRQTSAIFLPNANVSYTAISTNDPLNAFAFKLQQQIVSNADFNPSKLNNPGESADFLTKISIQQPVLNADMLYQRKGAALMQKVYKEQTNRTIDAITWQVQQTYLQLQMTWKAVSVLQTALNTAKSIYKVTKDRYDLGLLQKSDLLNVSVEVKSIETQLLEMQSRIANISDMLNLLMNKTANNIYTCDSSITINYKDTQSIPEQRADLNALNYAINAQDALIKADKASYLPRINAFGYYQWHDKSALGYFANAYMGGIQLSWDVFRGLQNTNKIAAKQLEKNKTEEQLRAYTNSANIELTKTKRSIADASAKIKQYEEAVLQATEANRINQNRYEQGLVSTTDVLLTQAQLSRQELALAQAIFEKNSAHVYLNFLTTVHQ